MITPAGTVEIGCSRTRIAVTTPKFPPPPRSPEQVGLMLGVGGDEASVVQHDIGTQQVVQRQPGHTVQAAVAAADGQARHADLTEIARRGH